MPISALTQFEPIRRGRMSLSLASCETEVREAQRLRHDVFGLEMGASINAVDGRDVEELDRYCEHLLLRDDETGDVVGCYRILTAQGAKRAGRWYSQSEFDMGNLLGLMERSMELGRACVRADRRGGAAIMMLWTGLVSFAKSRDLVAMLGCGSISVMDGGHGAASLFEQMKASGRCAPERWRVYPKNRLPLERLDRTRKIATPPLMKGYLRAGAYICGEPCLDPRFHCADVIVLMPLQNIAGQYGRHFS